MLVGVDESVDSLMADGQDAFEAGTVGDLLGAPVLPDQSGYPLPWFSGDPGTPPRGLDPFAGSCLGLLGTIAPLAGYV